jgi:hypothetical protein
MAPSASPCGHRLFRTSLVRFSIGASVCGPAATRWLSRGVCARTTPTGSTSAGGITKEEQHQAGCWETAAWDVELSLFSTQLWKLNTTEEALRQTHKAASS